MTLLQEMIETYAEGKATAEQKELLSKALFRIGFPLVHEDFVYEADTPYHLIVRPCVTLETSVADFPVPIEE